MKQKGLIRNIDILGRICLPKGFRNQHGIKNGDPVEIFDTGEGILLKRYDPEPDILEKVGEIERLLDSAALPVRKTVEIRGQIEDIRNVLEGGDLSG